MGPIGFQEAIVLFVLALLLFGPKKLPELGRTFGKAMAEFRRASSELKAQFDREMVNIERETESLKQETQKYSNELYSHDSSHDRHQYDPHQHDPYHDSGYPYSPEAHETSPSDPSHVGASATQGADQTASAVPKPVTASVPEGTVPVNRNGSTHPEPETTAGPVTQA